MTDRDARPILVWNLPLRVFHLFFAVFLGGAFITAMLTGEHSRWFSWHMVLGVGAALMLLIRIVLGLLDRGYGSLRGMLSAPLKVGPYVATLIAGKPKRHPGHNPLASIVYLLLFIMVIGSVWTGLAFGGDSGEDLHEFFAYGGIALTLLHLAGLVMHRIMHRENLVFSMLHGRKSGLETEALSSARPVLGLATLALALLLTGPLLAGYDAASQTVRLPFTGGSFTLGEDEGEHEHEKREDREHRRRGQDDDHDDDHGDR